MTSGERRLGERLEQKLDDDYVLWYDVPIGPKQTHLDFVVLHPRRGLLILEFDDKNAESEMPDIMRVMDLQQEQLARSLGDGHRVIHGVAGSGKTMILGYRAEYLAKTHTPTSKPIFILCLLSA